MFFSKLFKKNITLNVLFMAYNTIIVIYFSYSSWRTALKERIKFRKDRMIEF